MSKKVIRMTESDFHRIVEDTVSKVLNEGTGTVQELEKAYGILKNVSESGYIPFASQNPSGTENEIKKAIIEAMRLISKACYLDRKCYGNWPVAQVVY